MIRLSTQYFRTVLAVGCLAFSSSYLGAEQVNSDGTKRAASAQLPADIKQFCANNAAIAGDAKIAWQVAKLREIEAQINQRIAELEIKTEQASEWLKKREQVMKKASDSVIAIYAQLKPSAAASHLAAMEDALAAAILAKLPPRAASAILNEMEPARASQLTSGLVAREEKKS